MSYQEETFEALETEAKEKQENHLVLFNDDVNTFDFVIESLIDVCQHDREQAEQCSIIVHNNGKCSVKSGTVDKLRPMADALLDRGLSASID
ncbi:MAG: ATP-dependent Clp protease adaptor ClpS [Bacteroidia bacterium]|nr:ATP-dependent Clp protease adaptor ClpS [Bacteroidia bacterium]NNC86788.1 ATP-dependent Clp protease adaptor ClpS [Bacteroidia bacterium]NNM16183.1 ATP-dependent Clp protease adaptor ClpS [Bacteroidia bacterium]